MIYIVKTGGGTNQLLNDRIYHKRKKNGKGY